MKQDFIAYDLSLGNLSYFNVLIRRHLGAHNPTEDLVGGKDVLKP